MELRYLRVIIVCLMLLDVRCTPVSMVEPTPNPLAECSHAGDCDDGVFCNGAEACQEGVCVAGQDPCPPVGECVYCNEESDTCASPCLDDADCPSIDGFIGRCDECGICALDSVAADE